MNVPRPIPMPEPGTGRAMHALVAELYPICRSITGDGVRRTLEILARRIPLQVQEIATGTPAFDWTVPREWNIRDAYVKNDAGERVIDFRSSNLHVVSYSAPFRGTVSLAELRRHVHTLPEHPDWIPYRTSYYREDWGLCAAQRTMDALAQGQYEVCIDADLADGHLTYAECLIPGATREEVLLSCHVCHPSLCNDNLSGIALVTFLARHLATLPLRYSYRILLIPGTIGSIVWLSRNEARLEHIRHGLVVTCIGDAGPFTYKRSRRGDAEVDHAVEHVLKHGEDAYGVQDFFPYGYDERQYCSPAFDLPVGCLMRTPHGKFPEYHTSADNLDLVRPEALQRSLETYLRVIDVLEGNLTYRSTNPKCEPQLGRRGLYSAIGGDSRQAEKQMAMLWVLNLADGHHTLLEMAERANVDFALVRDTARTLFEHDLLESV